jgi:hypothetical protein
MHFPAGSYDKQMKKRYGNLELVIMKKLWRTFKAVQRRDRNLWQSERDKLSQSSDIEHLTNIGVWMEPDYTY